MNLVNSSSSISVRLGLWSW